MREIDESKILVVDFIELIVLSVRPEPPDEIDKLAKKLDLKLEGYEFWDTKDVFP